MFEFHVENLYTRLDKKKTTVAELKLLHKLLSVKVPGHYFSPHFRRGLWDGYRRFFNLLTGTLYTGLLYFAIRKLSEAGISIETECKIIDEREKIPHHNNPISLSGIELRDYQEKIINEAVKKERGIISAPPNAGKSECAAGIIQVLGLPANFFTHRLTLLRQTKERFEKRLGIEIGILGGGEEDIKDVNILSVASVVRKLDEPHIKELLKNTPIIIVDECHHASARTFEKCFKACPNAMYRFGLSATPLLKDDISNMIVRGLTGDEIVGITNQQLIESGISALPSVYLLNVKEPKIPAHYTFDQAYDTGILRNDYRNRLIVNSAKHFLAKDKSVFILVWRIEHGEILLEQLQKEGIEVEFISGQGTNTGQVQDVLNRFSKKELKCVISSTISDEGIDVPCHPPYELILKDGHTPTPICELKEGDLVRSHKGNLVKIHGIESHNVKEDLVEIKLFFNHYPLTLTKEHKVPIYRNGVLKWIQAAELKLTDSLIYSLPKRYSTLVDSIKISDYISIPNLCNDETYIWSRYSNTIHKETAANIARKLKIPSVHIVRNFLQRSRLNKRKIRKSRSRYNTILTNYCKIGWVQQKKIRNIVGLTEDFCRLIGYYIAEGSGSKVTYFSFHKNETFYQNDVISLLKQFFNETPVRNYNRNSCTITICNKIITQFFSSICGKGAKNKQIPDFIFNSSKECKKGLVQGMWRGDGSCGNRSFGYSSASKKLLFQLKEMLLDFGIVSSIKFLKGDNNLGVFGVGWKELCNLLDLNLKDPNSRRTYSRVYKTNKDHVIFSIKDIRHIPYEGKVYNLTVEKEATYTTCSATVHNSMDCLILGVGFKAPLKTIQRVGRGLRKKIVGENVVTIVDFVDCHSKKYLYKHSIDRVREYVNMGIRIFEVIDNDWKVVEER